ncbi:hypothetical protein BDQ17DRAFT_1441568 [Cyathus striatus]|nr:hypothetical protein BDQ17DRAFT_1441568 [Cyathus striatus]
MAQCQKIAAKAATEVAAHAMVEAISEVKARVAAQCAEAEAARWAEEERQAEAEANAEILCLKSEADAARQAKANAVAASFFPESESLISSLAGLFSSFTALDASTAPPSPAMEEEDELLEDNVSPQLDLSTVAAGKYKAAPKPITTFAPASKCCKIPGGVEITVLLEQIIPLPESPTPSMAASEPKPAFASGYHLCDCSITSTPELMPPSHSSTRVATRTPAKAATSKSSKASKASNKATGTKAVKCTHVEIPQLTSDELINVELLQKNLQELIKHFGAHVCINLPVPKSLCLTAHSLFLLLTLNLHYLLLTVLEGPSGSSSVRAICEGNIEHSVVLSKED